MNENFGVVAHVESYGVTVTLYGTIGYIYVNARDVADWIDHRLGRSEVMLEKTGIIPLRIENEPYITIVDAFKLVAPYFPRGNGRRFMDAILKHIGRIQDRDMIENNDVEDKDVTYSMNDLADIVWNRFSMGQNKLSRWLVNHGYIYRTPENKYMPYQRYIDKGWFLVHPKNNDRSYTEVTYKGKEYIVNLLERH